MAKFENLKKAFIEKEESLKMEELEGIQKSSEENKFDFLRRNSTDKRWAQFQEGKISEEQAKQYAMKRVSTQYDKIVTAKLEEVDRIAEMNDLRFVDIDIEWSKSGNAMARVRTNNDYKGKKDNASGWGFDKASTAAAGALNQCWDILKALYQYKEDRLASGEITCKADNNTEIITYGAGYDIFPDFAWGVGMNCFERIFNLMGYKMTVCHFGESFDYYRFEKQAENVAA